MTEFEKDVAYANEFVEVIKAVIENRIYDNPLYRKVYFNTDIEVLRENSSFLYLYENHKFGITMTLYSGLQINASDEQCDLLEEEPIGWTDIYDMTTYTEEQHFQDSLIVSPSMQREIILVATIRDYLRGTQYESIEITRKFYDLVKIDVDALENK